MVPHDQSPATKGDLQQFIAHIERVIGDLQKNMNEQLEDFRDELRGEMQELHTETRRHFDVVAEDIKHDFQGAFHDKLEQHDDRILRLEQHVGLTA